MSHCGKPSWKITSQYMKSDDTLHSMLSLLSIVYWLIF